MNTIPDLIPLYDNRPGLRSLLQVEVRGVNQSSESAGEANGSPSLDFIASTATFDRYHEIIEPAGWRLDSYRRNPVFQNADNYGDILFTLGKALSTEVRLVDGRPALCQRIQFATEVNPMARIAYGLYSGGFLNAVSVGFIPLKWEDGKEVKSAEFGVQNGENHLSPDPSPTEPVRPLAERGIRAAAARRRYLEQELLEVSAVAIPANPDALALGLKSGAVARSDLREAMDLLGALVGVDREDPSPRPSPAGRGGIVASPSLCLAAPDEISRALLDLARELGRVMQMA